MIKHVLESSGQRVIRITQRERSPTTLKFRNPLTKKSSSNFAGISDHLRSDNDICRNTASYKEILQILV